jgi:hypothetical protein
LVIELGIRSVSEVGEEIVKTVKLLFCKPPRLRRIPLIRGKPTFSGDGFLEFEELLVVGSEVSRLFTGKNGFDFGELLGVFGGGGSIGETAESSKLKA